MGALCGNETTAHTSGVELVTVIHQVPTQGPHELDVTCSGLLLSPILASAKDPPSRPTIRSA